MTKLVQASTISLLLVAVTACGVSMDDLDDGGVDAPVYTGQCEQYGSIVAPGDLLTEHGFSAEIRYDPTSSGELCDRPDAGCYETEWMQFQDTTNTISGDFNVVPCDVDWFCGYCFNEHCLHPLYGGVLSCPEPPRDAGN